MKTVDISNLNEIKKELDAVCDSDALMIVDGKEEKYVVITANEYDSLIENKVYTPNFADLSPEISIVTPDDFDLSDDEFEELKNMLLEAMERKLKKPNTKS
ncbi:MAG: hypothetical protein R3Y57_03175 [Erysipelotrichaceae bacterium]